MPREKIKPITTKDPNDPRAPFFNAHADAIPPLARLIIRREKASILYSDQGNVFSNISTVSFSALVGLSDRLQERFRIRQRQFRGESRN